MTVPIFIPVIVPKDVCPFDHMIENQYETKDAWLVFHQSAIERFKRSKGVEPHDLDCLCPTLSWPTLDEKIQYISLDSAVPWNLTTFLKVKGISFTSMKEVPNPKILYLIKMEE